MSRFERTQYFERLVELHVAYAMRGDDDRTVAITIADVIELVENAFASSPVPDRRSEIQD